MATFEARIIALTGITFSGSTNPTQAQLTEMINDGVLDVTTRWIALHPQDRELFMNETGLQVAQGADIGGADIISVVRADGVTAGNFRPCRRIPPAQQSVVTDKDSLSFASAYNPVYMVSGSNVKVFPAPADNSGKDSYNVFYVNNTPKDSNGTSLTYADSALGYFPASKLYLVVLYASYKAILANMAAITMPSDTIVAVPPDSPVVPDFTVSLTSSLPTYTTPGISGITTDITETIIAGTLNDDASQIDVNTWWETWGDLIEGSEDPELAGSHGEKVATFIDAYRAAVDGQVQKFNSDLAAYQAEVEVVINEARFERSEKYTPLLQQYQAEISEYQAEVQAEVQRWSTQLQVDVQDFQTKLQRFQALKAEYELGFLTSRPPQPGPAPAPR